MQGFVETFDAQFGNQANFWPLLWKKFRMLGEKVLQMALSSSHTQMRGVCKEWDAFVFARYDWSSHLSWWIELSKKSNADFFDFLYKTFYNRIMTTNDMFIDITDKKIACQTFQLSILSRVLCDEKGILLPQPNDTTDSIMARCLYLQVSDDLFLPFKENVFQKSWYAPYLTQFILPVIQQTDHSIFFGKHTLMHKVRNMVFSHPHGILFGKAMVQGFCEKNGFLMDYFDHFVDCFENKNQWDSIFSCDILRLIMHRTPTLPQFWENIIKWTCDRDWKVFWEKYGSWNPSSLSFLKEGHYIEEASRQWFLFIECAKQHRQKELYILIDTKTDWTQQEVDSLLSVLVGIPLYANVVAYMSDIPVPECFVDISDRYTKRQKI